MSASDDDISFQGLGNASAPNLGYCIGASASAPSPWSSEEEARLLQAYHEALNKKLKDRSMEPATTTRGILWAVLKKSPTVDRIHPNGEPHHITLQYDVELNDCLGWIDRCFEVTITEHCWNDRIQALRVELPFWLPNQNLHPHITVSWAEGVQPVESNVMLETNDYESSSHNEILEVETKFHPFIEQSNERS